MEMYDFGDRVRILTTTPFGLVGGSKVDPDVVTIKTKNPANVVVTHTYGEAGGKMIRDTIGDYHLLVNGDVSGTWYYRIFGVDAEGDYMGASAGAFGVKADTTA
jgi:hypothetical protein